MPRRVIARLAEEFRRDWVDQYLIVEVSADLAESAMDLAEKHGLRGYDAVHLAAALAVQDAREAVGSTDLTFTGCFKTSTGRGGRCEVLDTGVTAIASGQRF